jgi:predicted alpha/beta superfamily hydrolase
MKKLFKTGLFLLLFLLAITQTSVIAQNQSEINDSIFSKEINELRKLKIRLPENYKPGSSEKYEAIYIVDGEWNFDLFTFTHKFLLEENFMPNVILVAIPNTYIDGVNMRDRDFLPHKFDDNTLSGGANKFIAFIKNELFPYINKKYPTNGVNSLFGHSYGGLFSMYTFLTNTEMFDKFYCSDPAFRWDNNYIVKLAGEKFKKGEQIEKTVWINGIKETYKGMSIDKMDSVFKYSAPKSLYWKIDTFPNETHNSVRYKGVFDGLKFAYDGFSAQEIQFHPMTGVLIKDKPTKIFLNGNYPNARYTTDGSEPDLNSLLAGQAFEIKGPTKLVLKSFGGNKKYGAISKGNFELGEVFPAITKLKNAKQGGFKYSYYEGKWDSLPDFSKLKPIKTGITDSTFKLNKLKSQSNFGCVFEGYIKVETDGYYLFGLDSDDGSKFYFNNKLIISNDGRHATGNIKTYIVPLQKGFYPVKVEFFQREGGMDLQLIYLTPESQRPIPIPSTLKFYTK